MSLTSPVTSARWMESYQVLNSASVAGPVGRVSTSSSVFAMTGLAFPAGGDGDLLAQGVLGGQQSPDEGRADARAGPGVRVPHDRRGGVARRVQALDRLPVGVDDPPFDVGDDAARGAHVTGVDLHRVERGLGHRAEARVLLVGEIAEE